MVDTYGGLASHGGGALCGKDPTKVDRSGAYMARYIAKHIVWCGYAKKCEVGISYAIGKANPVAFTINTFGTGTVPDEILALAAQEVFNLRPAAIIEKLRLRNIHYSDTAVYGHFNSYLFPWEDVNKYSELKKAVEKYAD
jgi:S-adenosylmethionine synthetase